MKSIYEKPSTQKHESKNIVQGSLYNNTYYGSYGLYKLYTYSSGLYRLY